MTPSAPACMRRRMCSTAISTKGIPFISALNLDGKTVVEDENLLCLSQEQYDRLGNGKLKQGDIVVCIRGSLGKHGRYPFAQGAIASSLVILRQFFLDDTFADFIMMYLDSPLFFAEIKRYDNGTAQPNLAAKSLEQFLFPLPPISEQKRIVAKIEELLPYIDRYEKAWSRLEDFNKRFPTDMQKSILQLAIQGKLVPQRPEEGTGEALYQQIQAEKQSLIRSGKLKKERPLPEITDEEIPFEIPESWIWVRLDDILLAMGAGKSIRCNEVVPEDGQPGIIKVSAVTWGEFAENESKTCLSQTDWIEDYRINAGDFLISRANTKKLVGACVIVNNIQKKLMLSDKILRLRFSGHLDLVYLLFAMRSASTREQIEAMATGTSDSMKNISQKGIRRLIVPLPPLAEQKRIVAKLEELLPLCERLK